MQGKTESDYFFELFIEKLQKKETQSRYYRGKKKFVRKDYRFTRRSIKIIQDLAKKHHISESTVIREAVDMLFFGDIKKRLLGDIETKNLLEFNR